MQVKYVGMFDEVLAPAVSGSPIRKGETIEVDDALGADLLRQEENWASVSPSKPSRENKATAQTAEPEEID